MEANEQEYQDWCFENHIYVYGLTGGCPEGMCKLVLWNRGQPKIGAKLITLNHIDSAAMELYKAVYKKNNPTN